MVGPLREALGAQCEDYRLTHRGQVDHEGWMPGSRASSGAEPRSRFLAVDDDDDETNGLRGARHSPVVNAAATLTRLGGSRMPPPVLEAMHAGAESFVDLVELQQRLARASPS